VYDCGGDGFIEGVASSVTSITRGFTGDGVESALDGLRGKRGERSGGGGGVGW